MGALAAILVITNPESLKTLKPLISLTEGATMTQVVSLVNESY